MERLKVKFLLHEPDILTSEDCFPFGQYKDIRIKDVPLTYLLTIHSSTWLETKNPTLKHYLDEHIQDHIDREYDEYEEEFDEYYKELDKVVKRSKPQNGEV